MKTVFQGRRDPSQQRGLKLRSSQAAGETRLQFVFMSRGAHVHHVLWIMWRIKVTDCSQRTDWILFRPDEHHSLTSRRLSAILDIFTALKPGRRNIRMRGSIVCIMMFFLVLVGWSQRVCVRGVQTYMNERKSSVDLHQITFVWRQMTLRNTCW